MCVAIPDHYVIDQGTVDTKLYSMEMIHSCAAEMLQVLQINHRHD